MAVTVQLRDVVVRHTGTVNPAKTPHESFLYVDVAAVDSSTKCITGARLVIGSDAPSRARKALRCRDVIVSTVRPNLNAVALVSPELDGAVASTGFCVLRATELVLPEYLAFFTRSRAFVDNLSQLVAGAMYPAVTDSQVLDQELPLPPLPEQRRIVDLLSRAERIVRMRREAEKKAAELLPALFIDMFGDPATNPKGWPVVAIGDLLTETPTLGTMLKPSPEQGEWLDLRVANIQDGSLTLEDKKWLDLAPVEVDRFSICDGDVLLARAIGSLDHLGKAVVAYPTGKWTFDSHLMRLRFNKNKILPEVFKTYLESGAGRQEFLMHTRRSAVQFNINGKEIRRIKLPLPPLEMQGQFLSSCREMTELMARQDAATEKATAVFNSTLARAFRGSQESAVVG